MMVSLSARQRQVLLLAAQGGTDKEMSQRMQVSPRTVRSHLARACERLGAVSRTNAVAIAVARGLIFFTTELEAQ